MGKIQNFKKQIQNVCEHVAKIFRILDSFSKRDLSASPIDGLAQNINID